MTTYAIGDIQGCQDRLELLLQQIEDDANIVFVGDLVNRGPRSLQTLRQVRALGERAQVVLGNHDLHLLAVANGIRPAHRSDTLDEILNAPDRDALLGWLRMQPLAVYVEDHLIVHAGVLPQWTRAQTLELAQEVEAVLRGDEWLRFLRQMYGNTPARWSDELSGVERWRCIVNALTRLRFCSADGTMDLTSKGVETEIPGHMPWFEVPGRKTADETIVFGHWSTLGLMLRPRLISLDTGCLWGGKLTALRLSDRRVLQVDCPRYLEPGSI